MTCFRRRASYCFDLLHIFSALLLLSILLPSTTFAQPPPDATSINPSPTTLQTSTVLPSTPSNAPSSTESATPASDNGPTFNYYFVIVAIAALAAVLILILIGRRKKQRALMRSSGQVALARDVEGLRHQRFGGPRAAMRRVHIGGGMAHMEPARTEGLDELGEAPPPYNAGLKPPSISAGVADGVREVSPAGDREGGVELTSMPTPRRDPPGYHEDRTNNAGSGGFEDVDLDMRRPAPAVTAPARVGL